MTRKGMSYIVTVRLLNPTRSNPMFYISYATSRVSFHAVPNVKSMHYLPHILDKKQNTLAVAWFQHFAVLVQGQLVTCPSEYKCVTTFPFHSYSSQTSRLVLNLDTALVHCSKIDCCVSNIESAFASSSLLNSIDFLTIYSYIKIFNRFKDH